MRIGFGWDSHRLVPARRLMLGGVHIACPVGEDGHSDGDVLLHALIDAFLGAAALGDIGTYFPSSDDRWKDADSMLLLEKTYQKITAVGLSTHNIDITVIVEQPELSPYIEQIRTSIASIVHTDISQVSVKAKSAEGIGPVGEGKSIEAHAAVLLNEETPDIWI